jgi:sulfatase-like protein
MWFAEFAPLSAAIGFVLTLAAWIAPRRVAGARGLGVATVLDAAPLAVFALLLVLATGRPVFAGAVAFALGGGFAFADRTVRDTLREPTVFSALSELPQIFTHPQLYLPFAGTGLVLGIVGVAVGGGLALLIVEPALTVPHPLAATFLAAAIVAVLWRIGREPWLGAAAAALRRLRPSGDPFADAIRLGPVAMLIVHGIIARAERPARQARLAPRPMPGAVAGLGPIVLVQCESFFDLRRALPDLRADVLAGYDAACAGGLHGRLDVPAWGANSTRAEFAVATGIDDGALGYDRFNPYHALTRAPIASQVWRLRAAGYETICLHPFDRWFYRRDQAMPALGFERFLGSETLGGSRTPPYMSDPELADRILRIIDSAGRRVFVFAITMGNHGPWFGASSPTDVALAPVPQGMPQRDDLARYLSGLRQSDEMLRILTSGLESRPGALLGFYGDHLPSLPRAFAHLGFDDQRSDYVIWSAPGEMSRRGDLAAHELGRTIVDRALSPRNSIGRAIVVPEPHHA